MYQGKYLKLGEFLSSQNTSSITLTMKEIEQILGFTLPNSSNKYTAWWSNEQEGSHTQAKSWMQFGWKVDKLEIGKEVTFIRTK